MSDTSSMAESIAETALSFSRIVRQKAPLVHHITNYVVMNFTANVTLALGAQPIMSHAVDEMDHLHGFCSALILNIGTLDRDWIGVMLEAGKTATHHKLPIVLDPVGAGATRLRTDTARRILDSANVTIVRANAGEMFALAGDTSKVSGVDSLADSHAAIEIAKDFAKARNVIVAMTGISDVVTDGTRVLAIDNGHAIMSRVTGTGCAATTAVASFVGVASDSTQHLDAAASALAIYGRCGEIAAARAHGSGTFVPAFVDALFNSTRDIQPQDLHIRVVA